MYVRHRRLYRRGAGHADFANGLQKLEYRGYDSAGVAVYNDTGLHVVKSKGRLSVLEGILEGGRNLPGTVGIGHTRWATHGAPATSTPILRSAMGANLWWCITASSRITWS